MSPRYKEYEIWIGKPYCVGQGMHDPTKPEMLGKVWATSFKIACYLYELESAMDSIYLRMAQKDDYIEDIHFGILYYLPATNSNQYRGKYYQSEKEALESLNELH